MSGGSDDRLVAEMVGKCLNAMNGYPTIPMLTACYSLTDAVLRVCAVCGEKQTIIDLLDEFHKEMRKSIEEYYGDET